MKLVQIARVLSQRVDGLRFDEPVDCVYNPLSYAWRPHRRYLERFGGLGAPVLLVGMNPGPFGMAQTGVPFGEVESVRGWMGIDEPVGRPEREHPRRPVQGFACTRSEVSGRRLWGWARARFGSAESFFKAFFVTNYCPLSFMVASGRNLTPDKLGPTERDALFAACDDALRETVGSLRPRLVLGIGRFAESRVRRALTGAEVEIGTLLHPSPASPAANRGWSARAEGQLAALGVALPEPIPNGRLA